MESTTKTESSPGRSRAANLDAVPAPWDYNPSSWQQRVPICFIAIAGFGIAVYLALYQWRLVDGVWDPFFGKQSERVLDSQVAKRMHRWFGVSDAAFGALAYLGDAVFGLAGSTRRWQYRPWLVVLFGIDVIPLGIVGAILVFLQGAVVGSWCTLCIASAIISLVLVAFAYDEVWSCLLFLHRVWKRTRSPRILWNTFWGRREPLADAVALER